MILKAFHRFCRTKNLFRQLRKNQTIETKTEINRNKMDASSPHKISNKQQRLISLKEVLSVFYLSFNSTLISANNLNQY